jgi:hypothetical protein
MHTFHSVDYQTANSTNMMQVTQLDAITCKINANRVVTGQHTKVSYALC